MAYCINNTYGESVSNLEKMNVEERSRILPPTVKFTKVYVYQEFFTCNQGEIYIFIISMAGEEERKVILP